MTPIMISPTISLLFTEWSLFGINMNALAVLLYIGIVLGFCILCSSFLDRYKHNLKKK